MRDQIVASDQQARALRSAHCLAAAEGNEIVAHVGVIPEMGNRRRVRCGIVHARNVVLLAQLDPLVHFDLAGRIGKV